MTNCIDLTNDTCQQLAFNMASGQESCGFSVHNKLGYAFYRDKMEEMKEGNISMLAICNKFLAEDWDKLEQAFGPGKGPNGWS